MDTSANILSNLWEYIKSVFSFDPNSPLLFTQFQFWAFFAIVFTFFALFRNKPLLRNTYLFLVSLFFYYKTSGLFVGLLIFVTITDFFIAKGIYKLREAKVWKRRALLYLSICIDLSILCYFKYTYFFTELVNTIFGTNFEVNNVMAGLGNSILGTNFFDVDNIVLPVGISFYTFQIISYTCDVYRGLIKPVRNFLDFGFYVSFFPQLVAGPIVKASDFVPQLHRKYNLSRLQFGIAVFWIVNGLLKKLILADFIGVSFVDRVFDDPALFTGFENVCAALLYSLQIYGDFSGYTDIAIGLSLLMGFYLPANFNSPYKATNCSNFWKRWHISLSRWLMNYLYIPLGGNRNITFGTYFWIIFMTIVTLILCGNLIVTGIFFAIFCGVVFTAIKFPDKCKKIYASLNNMITMLLGGLWHGASLNFIAWGGLNGLGMIVFKFWHGWSNLIKALVSTIILQFLYVLNWLIPGALLNILMAFMLFISVSMWIKYIYSKTNSKKDFSWLEHGWSIFVTYIFMIFTFVFFRSGSNIDPSDVNGAWVVCNKMIQAIGTQWNTNILPIIGAYYHIFLIYIIGMTIHWLPSKFKRRYRYSFAKLPIPVICLCAVLAVFIAYQFITADLQPFIYFQF